MAHPNVPSQREGEEEEEDGRDRNRNIEYHTTLFQTPGLVI